MNTSPIARLATTAAPGLRARACRRASTRDSGARDRLPVPVDAGGVSDVSDAPPWRP
jgi:hypothetical protein